MYIKTSSYKSGGDIILIFFEGTDVIQIGNIIFYDRFSAGENKSMGRFRI